MALKMTYFWIIYSCLIFGSGILCDRKLKTITAAVSPTSSSIGNSGKNFYCTNGVSIEISRVCDGYVDCLDSSDETNVLCARKENDTNMTTDCGTVHIHQRRISNGQRAIFGTAPWNAGIYRFNNRNSKHELICGGSIISSNLVISAARCFYENGMSTNSPLKSDGLYKIGVGKYDRNISIIDNIFTQIMDVDIVYLKESFYGASGFYGEDIAIIVLKNRVSFSNSVAPVCVDWNGRYNVVNGDQGKIVGWGYPNNGSISNILLELSLPYINHGSCRNLYKNGFEVYLTADKFCAGSARVPGKGVNMGYAGAGLSFLHANSYYLTGITNVKDPDTNNSIALFTEVRYHIQWIRGLYNKHN